MRQVAITTRGGIAAVEIYNRQLTGWTFCTDYYPRPDLDWFPFGNEAGIQRNKLIFEDFADDFIQFISNADLIVNSQDDSFRWYEINDELARLQRGELSDYCHGILDVSELFRQYLGHDFRVSIPWFCRHYRLSHLRNEYGDSGLSDAMVLGAAYLIRTDRQHAS